MNQKNKVSHMLPCFWLMCFDEAISTLVRFIDFLKEVSDM